MKYIIVITTILTVIWACQKISIVVQNDTEDAHVERTDAAMIEADPSLIDVEVSERKEKRNETIVYDAIGPGRGPGVRPKATRSKPHPGKTRRNVRTKISPQPDRGMQGMDE